jgi:hypothetical protein
MDDFAHVAETQCHSMCFDMQMLALVMIFEITE